MHSVVQNFFSVSAISKAISKVQTHAICIHTYVEHIYAWYVIHMSRTRIFISSQKSAVKTIGYGRDTLQICGHIANRRVRFFFIFDLQTC